MIAVAEKHIPELSETNDDTAKDTDTTKRLTSWHPTQYAGYTSYFFVFVVNTLSWSLDTGSTLPVILYLDPAGSFQEFRDIGPNLFFCYKSFISCGKSDSKKFINQ